MSTHRRSLFPLWVLVLAACALSVPAACAFGPLSLPFGDVIRALSAKLAGVPLAAGCLAVTPEGVTQELDPAALALIAGDLRLPRVLLAFLTGTGLAVAGTVFQGILRNPLADPFTLGVSGGAAFGAALAISLGLGGALGGLGISLSAFAGAAAALGAVILLGSLGGGEKGRGLERETLVLAGVVISAFLAALIAMLKALDESSVAGIVFWLMGSFQGRGWTELALILPGLFLGGAAALFRARELDMLGLGDDTAGNLGLHAGRWRLFLLAAASAVTASCVAVAGIIGFIGLIIPHLCRLLLGARHSRVLPAAALCGGMLLLWSDAAARSILPRGVELPVGVITALLGGPFFCYILARSKTLPPRQSDLWEEPMETPAADGSSRNAGAAPEKRKNACGPLILCPAAAGKLEVSSLSFCYKGQSREALRDVSFTLEPGERVGLLGPNGSGKSTLLHCIAGGLTPQSGHVRINGCLVGSLKKRERARLAAMVPQRPEVVPALSARDLALMGRYVHTGLWRAYSPNDKAIADNALARTGAAHLAGRNAAALSGGELQRVFLARALAQGTPLLLLDEATSGLDPAFQTAAMDILMQAGAGRTILAAMHDLNLAALYCDRLLLLKEGRLVADGPVRQIFTQALLEEVYETPVTLVEHPGTGKPQALLLPAQGHFPSPAHVADGDRPEPAFSGKEAFPA